MRISAWLFVAALGVVLFGCTPKPDAVCAHLEEIGYNDDVDSCESNASYLQNRDPDGWKTKAECWMAATTSEQAEACN